jgi:hypothetical protein
LHLPYSCLVEELYIMLQCHRRCILHLHAEYSLSPGLIVVLARFQ